MKTKFDYGPSGVSHWVRLGSLLFIWQLSTVVNAAFLFLAFLAFGPEDQPVLAASLLAVFPGILGILETAAVWRLIKRLINGRPAAA